MPAVLLTPESRDSIARIFERNSHITLAQLAREIDDILAPRPPEVVENIPRGVTLTPEEESALLRFVNLVSLAAREWPETRQPLSDTQRRCLLQLLQSQKTLKKLSERVEAQLRVAFFNHLDCLAEQDPTLAINDLAKDKDGYYALDGSISDEHLDHKMTRETRPGCTTLEMADLEALRDKGIISHRDFLRMTTAVRVVSEADVMNAVAKSPRLAAIIAQAVTKTRPSNAMQIRKNA